MDEKNKVEYDGVEYAVSALAVKILVENYKWKENSHVNGWKFFTKGGIALSDLRDSLENCTEDDQ